jgi:hypothetical protein
MKKIFQSLLLTAFLASTFLGCKKDENQIIFQGGTAPVLTASTTAPLVLDLLLKNQAVITFNWNNPNYTFNTGISSQDVAYTIQIDTANANFAGAKLQEISISKDLTKTFTHGDFNTALAKLGITENVASKVDIRLKAAFAGNLAPLFSNVIKLTATTYLDVVYPVPTNLFVTGGATPLSWQCGCATDGTGGTQKFTKISSTAFEINITLTAGQSYLLLPVYGSWNAKYGFKGANNANKVTGDDFAPGGGDILSPTATKMYKITVEFKTGKFTVQ